METLTQYGTRAKTRWYLKTVPYEYPTSELPTVLTSGSQVLSTVLIFKNNELINYACLSLSVNCRKQINYLVRASCVNYRRTTVKLKII